MTSRDDINDMFGRGQRQPATHMIMWCDTFDYEDYPEYVRQDPNHEGEPGRDGMVTVVRNVRDYIASKNGKNMQRMMECYDLALPKGQQLNKRRVYNDE